MMPCIYSGDCHVHLQRPVGLCPKIIANACILVTTRLAATACPPSARPTAVAIATRVGGTGCGHWHFLGVCDSPGSNLCRCSALHLVARQHTGGRRHDHADQSADFWFLAMVGLPCWPFFLGCTGHTGPLVNGELGRQAARDWWSCGLGHGRFWFGWQRIGLWLGQTGLACACGHQTPPLEPQIQTPLKKNRQLFLGVGGFGMHRVQQVLLLIAEIRRCDFPAAICDL